VHLRARAQLFSEAERIGATLRGGVLHVHRDRRVCPTDDCAQHAGASDEGTEREPSNPKPMQTRTRAEDATREPEG